eukprot:6458484-Amphidinium_carterae.1
MGSTAVGVVAGFGGFAPVRQNKGSFGEQVEWIGAQIRFKPNEVIVAKRHDLVELLCAILDKPVVAKNVLLTFAGKASWVA